MGDIQAPVWAAAPGLLAMLWDGLPAVDPDWVHSCGFPWHTHREGPQSRGRTKGGRSWNPSGLRDPCPAACLLSHFSCAAPWTVAPQTPLSMEILQAGVGCHALLQGIFLTQGSNPRLMSPELASGLFTTSTTWEAPPCSHRDQI